MYRFPLSELIDSKQLNPASFILQRVQGVTMVKGGKTSIGYVYSVMQELQLLRDKVTTLTDTNRELAKALVRNDSWHCVRDLRIAMASLTIAHPATRTE